MWYNPDSMLNILAFSDVRKHFRVTMDTSVTDTLKVHMKEGHVLELKEVMSGLYLLHDYDIPNKKVSTYSFLTLVKCNKENFRLESSENI